MPTSSGDFRVSKSTTAHVDYFLVMIVKTIQELLYRDSREDRGGTTALLLEKLRFFLGQVSSTRLFHKSSLTFPSDSPKNRRGVFVWLGGAPVRYDSGDARSS